MPKKNIVDLILPNYNSSEFIDKTVQSIINQTFKNWKLFIIDDDSNKETKKTISKYKKNKKIKIIWLPKNKGAAYCRNLAIKKSNSKYIAFIDSDDIWKKNKLKLQLNFMKKNNSNFSYTYYETFGLKNKNVKTKLSYNFKNFTMDTSIATSTMIVSRKIIKNIKFTNTKICEDYFFKCSILKKIPYAQGLGKFLTKYRIRKNSLQSNKFKNLYWIWKINNEFNKFNFYENLISLFSISISSLKRYGLK